MALYKCFDELPERINEMYKNKKSIFNDDDDLNHE